MVSWGTRLPFWEFPKQTSLVAQGVEHLPAIQETQVQSLVWKMSWRRKWQPNPVLFLENPMEQEPGRLHTVHGVAKSWT